MSEITWTEDQIKAITLKNKNILVSAAAGSGKTALLTERLKRLILEDRIKCKNLLVLTFTRAAASEMKQRFKKKLFDSLNSGELGNLNEKEILNEINDLTDAQISTIHSFGQTILRRHFQILGIDPGFRIADEEEEKLIFQETLDEVFENLFIENEVAPTEETNNFIELVDLFGGQLSNDNLKKIISSLNKFLNTLEDPDSWIENFTNKIEDLNESNLVELDCLYPILEEFKPTVEQFISTYHEITKLDIPLGEKTASKAQLEKEIDAVDIISNSNSIPNYINNIKNFPIGIVRFTKKDPITLKAKNLRGNASNGIYKDFKEIVTFFNSFDSDEIETLKDLNRIFKNLIKLNKTIEKAIDKRKKKQGILFFSDLEKYLLKLLEIPEVQESIQNEFHLIYLDEVQDTNAIQEAIIQKIETGTNRFMVGDIKQSIVRPLSY